MKVTKEHYAHLVATIKDKVSRDMLDSHITFVKESGKAKNLEVRVVSDIARCVGSKWVIDNIYPYADDTHWLTASRKAFYEVFPDVVLA